MEVCNHCQTVVSESDETLPFGPLTGKGGADIKSRIQKMREKHFV